MMQVGKHTMCTWQLAHLQHVLKMNSATPLAVLSERAAASGHLVKYNVFMYAVHGHLFIGIDVMHVYRFCVPTRPVLYMVMCHMCMSSVWTTLGVDKHPLILGSAFAVFLLFPFDMYAY